MYNFKYFAIGNESDIDGIKKQYKKLAFQHHPDTGGTLEAMQEINAEYEKALKVLSEFTGKKYSYDIEFVEIIDALIKMNMQGVKVEICGFFIYVSGNTKPYCKELGKDGLGLYWHRKNICWYYKPAWYKGNRGKGWNMDKIRDVYGSEVVNNKANAPLPSY